MTRSQKLRGLYLIVTRILSLDKLLSATEKALLGGVDLMQLVAEEKDPETLSFAKELSDLARKRGTYFLINNSLSLAKKVGAEGLHFENYATRPQEVREEMGNQFLVGYTVGNDMKRLGWAENGGADYVSFCSIFPSCSAKSCAIVPLEKVKMARSKTSLPIFAAGGINLHNAHLVLEAGVDGIAVSSALLQAKDPERTARSFKEIIGNHGKSSS